MRLNIVVLLTYCLSCVHTSAQRISVPTKFSTPGGKITVYNDVYIPRVNNYNRGSSLKHEFTIVFLNDTTMTVKAAIDLSDSVHVIKWGKKENQVVIRPSETKEIYRMQGDKKISGKPMDSCWIFPAGFGRINTYSVTSDIDYPLIAYIQKGVDRPILSLTEENVREMVKDIDEAVKFVNRKKLLKAIEKYNEF